MYPTISYFLHDVFGVNIPLPIQSYGFMVALAFICGAVIMTYELKRKEKEGLYLPIYKKVIEGEPASVASIITSLIVGFVIGFKLLDAALNYNEFVTNPQGFILSGRGNFFGGIIFGIGSAFYTWWDKNRQKLNPPVTVEKEIFPHQLAGNILVIGGVAGILGAKIFHNLENFGDFMKDPVGEFFSFSGLTFLGGLIVGFSSICYYLYRNNISILHSMDIAAVLVPISYAVGRLGCQISGDGCWGIPNPNPKPDWLSWLPDGFWAYNYPHNVLREGTVILDNCTDYCNALAVPVFPTPLYESISMIFIFIVLWSLRKRIKIPAMLFTIYLMFAGIERFMIEQIRVNNKYDILGGVTQAEIISTILFLMGLAGFIFVLIKRDKVTEFAKTQLKDINRRTINHTKDKKSK